MRRVACNSCAPTPQAGLRREKHMPLSRRSIILALGSMPLLTRGVSSRTTAADGRRLLRLLQQNLGHPQSSIHRKKRGIPRVQFIEKGDNKIWGIPRVQLGILRVQFIENGDNKIWGIPRVQFIEKGDSKMRPVLPTEIQI